MPPNVNPIEEWFDADADDNAIAALQLWRKHNQPDTQKALMRNDELLWIMARDLARHLAGAMGYADPLADEIPKKRHV